MPELKVKITEYADDWNPGWVRCVFFDAYGKEWSLIEKIPVVTTESLDGKSNYPKDGFINAEIKRKLPNGITTIELSNSYGSEGDEQTVFDVLDHQIRGSQ